MPQLPEDWYGPEAEGVPPCIVMHDVWMREHTYTRTSGSGRYVQVKVAFEPQVQRSVDVSPNAFARLGDHSGDTEDYHIAVSSGAMSALKDAEAEGAGTILEVDYAPAHTTPDEVRTASYISVGYALRRQPSN